MVRRATSAPANREDRVREALTLTPPAPCASCSTVGARLALERSALRSAAGFSREGLGQALHGKLPSFSAVSTQLSDEPPTRLSCLHKGYGGLTAQVSVCLRSHSSLTSKQWTTNVRRNYGATE